MAQDPSRYALTVKSLDGTSYRVTASKEVIIQAGTPLYALSAASQLSKPGEDIAFTLSPLGTVSTTPATWGATRLEDQRTFSGAAQGEGCIIRFEQSGS